MGGHRAVAASFASCGSLLFPFLLHFLRPRRLHVVVFGLFSRWAPLFSLIPGVSLPLTLVFARIESWKFKWASVFERNLRIVPVGAARGRRRARWKETYYLYDRLLPFRGAKRGAGLKMQWRIILSKIIPISKLICLGKVRTCPWNVNVFYCVVCIAIPSDSFIASNEQIKDNLLQVPISNNLKILKSLSERLLKDKNSRIVEVLLQFLTLIGIC